MPRKRVYRFNRSALDPEFYRTEWARLRALYRRQKFGAEDPEAQRLYRDYRVYREERNAEYWRAVHALVVRCHADYGTAGCARVAGVTEATVDRWLRPGARPVGIAISRMLVADRAKGAAYQLSVDAAVAEAEELVARFGEEALAA